MSIDEALFAHGPIGIVCAILLAACWRLYGDAQRERDRYLAQVLQDAAERQRLVEVLERLTRRIEQLKEVRREAEQ